MLSHIYQSIKVQYLSFVTLGDTDTDIVFPNLEAGIMDHCHPTSISPDSGLLSSQSVFVPHYKLAKDGNCGFVVEC